MLVCHHRAKETFSGLLLTAVKAPECFFHRFKQVLSLEDLRIRACQSL